MPDRSMTVTDAAGHFADLLNRTYYRGGVHCAASIGGTGGDGGSCGWLCGYGAGLAVQRQLELPTPDTDSRAIEKSPPLPWGTGGEKSPWGFRG